MLTYHLHPNVSWSTSTKADGNMSFNHSPLRRTLQNRQNFLLTSLVLRKQTVAMAAQHKNNIVTVSTQDWEKGILSPETAISADGLLTSKIDTGLFLLTADCIPLVIYIPKIPLLGLIHLGWKNLLNGTLDVLHQKLTSEFQTTLATAWIGIGPSIHRHSYTHTDPVQIKYPEWNPFLKQIKNGSYQVDLIGFTKMKLESFQVKPYQIIDVGIDTYSAQDYFSHQKTKDTNRTSGRFSTLVYLKS